MDFILDGPVRSVERQRVDFLVIFQIVSWSQLQQLEDSTGVSGSPL